LFIATVDVAGSTLPVASQLKSLGVTIDSSLSFIVIIIKILF